MSSRHIQISQINVQTELGPAAYGRTLTDNARRLNLWIRAGSVQSDAMCS